MEKLRKSLAGLGLTAPIMSKSLAFGLVFGLIPVYVPTLPTIALSVLAKLFGLSVPASIIGLNLATPFFLMLMVPYVRAGEWLIGYESMAVDTLMSAMKADLMGALGKFGSRLGMAMVAWACSAPFLLALCYFIFLPICCGVAGSEVKAPPAPPPEKEEKKSD
mmetsp:Transcript_102752/g.204053  ORF Transcript_102752/g.204053 Transcript_102752/m.204053 type:complete len:163 (+) Transcript_102752:69-557(+)|eukprot:CAMPEP_0172674678 /NCGR_PEP_ID=MMETSP1074-20121228/12866_1 /TAXON_ID=2916 /ORGANISM="Ceratium fusus, Strain PA161109" /LENGTH=162 /DNA_ID=CAMNT_0013492101 /DNA_START=70 /DNA_END=558 /DNA_ORIENTATION=+